MNKTFKDTLNLKEHGVKLRGRVRLVDENGVLLKDSKGHPILEKDNLIVLRGRAFALENIFKSVMPEDSGYIANLNRSVCLFKIGSGGCDITSAPFQPFAPEFDDEDLTNPVPFIIHDPKKEEDERKKADPKIVSSLDDISEHKFYGGIKKTDGTTGYYLKTFEFNPQWSFNKEDNEVYKRIILKIEPNEARGYLINELGLFIASYNDKNNTYSDVEMFSRVTFDSISLTSLTKPAIFEYLVFA